MLLSWYLTSVEYFQKPNENMINNQVILNQMNSDSITVKTEVRLADQRQNHIILLYYYINIIWFAKTNSIAFMAFLFSLNI